MTLTTHIRVVEPTPVKPVFDECRRLLGAEKGTWFEDDGSGFRLRESGNRAYRNELGQGFAALLWVEWGADGPLREYENTTNSPDKADEDHLYRPAASIEVCFDTTYGYRAPNGAGCADLHAWLIVELGRWLDARGLTWYWENEFTGEWHKGNDSATALWEFGNPIKGCVDVLA